MASIRPTAQDLEGQITGVRQFDEMTTAATRGLRLLLECVGIADPEVLENTPRRVIDAIYYDMTEGYDLDPATLLARRFEAPGDDLVILKDVEFTSLCEHHLMPFTGHAHVAYIPNGFVVGLSKLARLVECYARRLQLQERMCAQIAGALIEHVSARGAACVVEASHSCLACRGARKQSSTFITSAMLGAFRENQELRQEFFAAIQLTHSKV